MSAWQSISLEELNALMREQNPLVLDIRDIQTYLVHHYPDALHIDASNLRAILKNTARDRPILIYCYHGYASQDMAQLFADFGFTHVYSLDGGYEAWMQYLEQQWSPTASVA